MAAATFAAAIVALLGVAVVVAAATFAAVIVALLGVAVVVVAATVLSAWRWWR